MARPPKTGLDYFPFDTSFDDKFEMLQAVYESKYKHASKAIVTGVITLLWQEIYKQGYFKEWSDRKSLIFASKCGINLDEFDLILNTALEEGIFNKNMYEKYNILTSAGIQKRYFSAVERRNGIDVENEYLLINIPLKTINDSNNSINANNNSVNVCNNATKEKKLKEIKLKESKSDKPTKHKYGKYKNVLLTEDELDKLNERLPNCKENLETFSEKLAMKDYKYKSHYLAMLNWFKDDRDKTPSYSMENIMKKVNNFD